jgi:hypothetical protein
VQLRRSDSATTLAAGTAPAAPTNLRRARSRVPDQSELDGQCEQRVGVPYRAFAHGTTFAEIATSGERLRSTRTRTDGGTQYGSDPRLQHTGTSSYASTSGRLSRRARASTTTTDGEPGLEQPDQSELDGQREQRVGFRMSVRPMAPVRRDCHVGANVTTTRTRLTAATHTGIGSALQHTGTSSYAGRPARRLRPHAADDRLRRQR